MLYRYHCALELFRVLNQHERIWSIVAAPDILLANVTVSQPKPERIWMFVHLC